jgi:hypothetical protein
MEDFRRAAQQATTPQPKPSVTRSRKRSGSGGSLGGLRAGRAEAGPSQKQAVGNIWRRVAVTASVRSASRGLPAGQERGRELSARALVASYLKLCRDPVKDLERWAAEDRRSKTRRSTEPTTTTKGGKHVRAETRQKDAVARAVGIRAKPLHELRGGVDPARKDGRVSGCLPARSRSGSTGDGELRPVRAEGGRDALSTGAFASVKADIAAAFGVERAAIVMFYAARLEAVRRGATPATIAAAIRVIVNERLVALRNLANRRIAATREAKPPLPERPPRANDIAHKWRAPGE